MLIHAAANSSRGTSSNTYAVALGARNEAELLDLEARLCYDAVPHAAFREPDRNNELMSIGIEPVERCMVRRYLRGLAIYGGEP